MSFIKPCFIQVNTPELRGKLEELGYRPVCINDCEPSLYTRHFENGWFYLTFELEYFPLNDKVIDCGTNIPLFLAIAALRDDSDYMQHFYNEYYKEWSICEQENALDYFNLDWMIHARKATAEELIEYFKGE